MMSYWVPEEFLEAEDVRRCKDEAASVSSTDDESSASEELPEQTSHATLADSDEEPIIRKFTHRKSTRSSPERSLTPTAQQILNSSFSQDEDGYGDDEEEEETESLNGFVVGDDGKFHDVVQYFSGC